MQNNYTFLTDHSYSIRLDYDKLPLKQREMKNKKSRGSSNRSSKATSANRTVSMHRSSSDKENSSSPSTDVSVTRRKTFGNKNKSSIKKKSPTVSRSQTGKKQNNKVNVKSVQRKTKSITKPSMNTSNVPASLSIEERVKLRRTTPFQTPVKSSSNIKKVVKRINPSKSKKTIIKSKKFFLGSGLDLDNIVLGSRQRRSTPT